VIALALPKGRTLEGEDLVYPPTAQGFRDFSDDSIYGKQARIMLQSFVAGFQMIDKGTPWLDLPQGHRKEMEIVAALCRKQIGQRKKDDKIKYDKHFKGGHTFDKELSKIICEALRSGSAPQVEGDGDGDDEPADGIDLGDEDSSSQSVEGLFQDDDQDEQEEEEVAPYAQELALLEEFDHALNEFEGEQPRLEDMMMDEAPAEEEEEDDAEEEDDDEGGVQVMEEEEYYDDEELDLDDFGELSIEVVAPERPVDPDGGRIHRRAHINMAAEQAAERLLNGVLKEKIEEKVKFIQVFFTNDADEDVGSIVFIFQMDPLYNFGEVLNDIITAKIERDASVVENTIGMRKKGYMSYQEPFPHLVSDKKHAVHHLDRECYTRIASSYSGDTSLRNDRDNVLREFQAWNITHVDCGDSPNPFHPLNVFTPQRALAYMQAAGASRAQCNVDLFRPYAVYDEERSPDGQSWCVPPQRSYWFNSKTVFWKRYGKVGLAGLCFPNIELPKVARNAMVVHPSAFDRKMQGDFLDQYFDESSGIVPLVPTVNWDPYAKIKMDAVHQLTWENLSFIKDLPKNPEVRGEAFDEFSDAFNKFKLVAVSKACQIFKPGNTNISEPLQAIETWQHNENIQKVSTYIPHTMPEMDTVANTIIRDAMLAKHYRHVAEEVRWWILCHYGLMDCYHYDHEVHLNLIFHGMSQTGKSYFLFDATTKTWIDGTVFDILESSNRADNTDQPVVDACIVQDEIKKEIVDGKAAEKDRSGFVEREKAKLTGCRLTYKVLTLRQDHSGRTERIAEWIETDHVATMAAATNKQVKASGDEALASRFGKFTICRPTCDVFEYMGIKNKLSSEDKVVKKNQVKHLRIMQMLSAKTQKLIQGAVIGQPSMDVFNVMFARMLAFLKEQGVDVSEQRQIQLMERFAYQLTIRKGIYDLYMRPGAPLFGKIFDLKDLIAHGDWLDKRKSEDALRVYRNAKRHFDNAETLIKTNEAVILSAQAQIAAGGDYGLLGSQAKKALAEVERLKLVATRHYNKMNTAFSKMKGSPGIEPFLSCTKQIAIFTFTLMGEMLIDPVMKVVLDAMCKFAGFRRNEGDGSEEVFRRDRANLAPWKIVETATDKQTETGERKLHLELDINYFEMTGVPKEIAGHVSEYTEPKVSADDCATYMNSLKRKFIRTHKYELISRSMVNSLGSSGGDVNRANFELRKSKDSKIIPILQYDYTKKRVYVSVDALERYNVDLLQQAVLYCIYDGWRDNQTFLFGLPVDGYTEVFNTIDICKSWGPYVPAIDVNNKFCYINQPIIDEGGRERLLSNVSICVDEHKKKIVKKEVILDEHDNPLYVEIPKMRTIEERRTPMLDEQGRTAIERKEAYKLIYKVSFPKLDKHNEEMYDTEGELIREYGVLVREPEIMRENAGLLDVCSMGPNFMVPEIAYIDNIASDLLCKIPWDPDSDVKVFPSDKCDRKIAVVEITEDLDDWGLEKHLLRNGIGGVVLKAIAKQGHIMDFIKAHVEYDADYRIVYHGDKAKNVELLSNYPINIIKAIDERREKVKKAREFEKVRVNIQRETTRRAARINVADFGWKNFVSGGSKRKNSINLQAPRQHAPLQKRSKQTQTKKKKKKKRRRVLPPDTSPPILSAQDRHTKRAAMIASDGDTLFGYPDQSEPIEFVAFDAGTADSILSGNFLK
jgi:hypothetical protein